MRLFWKFLNFRLTGRFSTENSNNDKQNVSEVNRETLPDGSEPVSIGSGTISGLIEQNETDILYEISNKQLGFRRTLKLLKPGNTKENQKRFVNRFAVAAQLTHPNITTVHNLGKWNGLDFVETERVSGFSAEKLISNNTPLPPAVCTAAGILICKFLEYIHGACIVIENREFRGFLHLDLKTGSLIFSNSGVLKVSGPGKVIPIQLARSGKFEAEEISPYYSAPEVMTGETTPDERSDLFSLGCILYELASGKKAVQAPEQSKEQLRIGKAISGLPAGYTILVKKCLSFRKEDRPTDAETVREELEEIHSRITSLSPENTISQFINQRKMNEPAMFPESIKGTGKPSKCISGSMVAVSACILLLAASQEVRDASKRFGRSLQIVSLVEYILKTGKSATSLPSVLFSGNRKKQTDKISPVQQVHSRPAEVYTPQTSKASFTGLTETNKAEKNSPPQTKDALMTPWQTIGKDTGSYSDPGIEINDGEHYLNKAWQLYGKQDYTGVLDNLNKADSLPSKHIEATYLSRNIQHLRAKTLTAVFRNTPSQANLTAALNSWEELLLKNSTNPDSSIYKEAEKEKMNLKTEASWRGIE